MKTGPLLWTPSESALKLWRQWEAIRSNQRTVYLLEYTQLNPILLGKLYLAHQPVKQSAKNNIVEVTLETGLQDLMLY